MKKGKSRCGRCLHACARRMTDKDSNDTPRFAPTKAATASAP